MDGVDRFRVMFDRWPQKLMWIVAVDLQTGRRVAFGRDLTPSVADAVAASCAVPGYYAPVTIGGRRYIDGGAWSMVSLDLLAGEDLDLVIVSAPLATADWVARDPGNAVRVPLRLQLQRERRRIPGRVLVVAPDARMRAVMGTNSMSAAKRAPVALAAREYAEAVFRRLL
jgi:NTE family protein